MKTPDKGGSYVRQKNGSLKRVEFTQPKPDREQEPETKAVKEKSDA